MRYQRSKRVLTGAVGILGALALAVTLTPASQSATQLPAQQSTAQIPTLSPAVAAKKPEPVPAPSYLPEGLQPAHSAVYWENSEACQNFLNGKVDVVRYDGFVEPFTIDPAVSRAVGCTEGYAAILGATDLALADAQVEDTTGGNLIAAWDGDSWTINHQRTIGEDRVYVEVWTFPQLRAFNFELGVTALERAQRSLDTLGVSVTDIHQLLGPNTPTWWSADTSAWTEWTSTHFSGEKRDGWQMREREVGGDTQEFSALSFYDSRGARLLGLDVAVGDSYPDPGNGSCEPEASYRIEASADIALEATSGNLKIALVTSKDVFGLEATTVQLIPATAKKRGSNCDLPRSFEIAGKQVNSSVGGPIGFERKREVKQFVKSDLWLDVVAFAQSLQVN